MNSLWALTFHMKTFFSFSLCCRGTIRRKEANRSHKETVHTFFCHQNNDSRLSGRPVGFAVSPERIFLSAIGCKSLHSTRLAEENC